MWLTTGRASGQTRTTRSYGTIELSGCSSTTHSRTWSAADCRSKKHGPFALVHMHRSWRCALRVDRIVTVTARCR
jgi:hypothetical protein